MLRADYIEKWTVLDKLFKEQHEHYSSVRKKSTSDNHYSTFIIIDFTKGHDNLSNEQFWHDFA